MQKHTSGQPLSEAERDQRRKAARARWAMAGRTAGVGAIAGGGVGLYQSARRGPRVLADALDVADRAVSAGDAIRRSTIEGRVKNEKSKVGSPASKKVYDYQIAALTQRLKRTTGSAATAVKSQITRLQQLAGQAPQRRSRAATTRVANRQKILEHMNLLGAQLEQAEKTQRENPHGSQAHSKGFADAIRIEQDLAEVEAKLKAHDVAAGPVNVFRGGETNKQVRQRIGKQKRLLEERGTQLLAHLDRRTAQLRETIRQATIHDTEVLLHARLLRTAGKGAAIGAVLGLTAAGIRMIAQHVHATEGKPGLRKATEETPEDHIGRGVAETFRQWIDRLLGRSRAPLNMGDGLAAAMAPGITQAFANGATQPPVSQPGQQYHVTVDFDQLNPSVRRHMAEYALDRIVDITNQQREAIRTTLMQQSVLQGIGPRDVARSLRESIGLTPHQTNIVRGYRSELESLDPAALERKLRDARYDRTVRRAIETGTPLSAEQIDAMVDAYHRRMLALRAETIARTESIRATSYGAVARAQDVLDQHPDLDVIKRWIATEDNRTRPTHRDLDGREVQGMQTAFKTSAGNFLRWPIDADGVADECINCLLPGTRIFAMGVRAVSRREFDGEIVIVETADGAQLSVTGNHPILSMDGWMAAQFLQEGDRVIGSLRQDWTSKVDNHEQRHPRIEDLEHAFRIAGFPTASKIAMAMDFHSEGQGRQVDITVANQGLMRANYAALSHPHGECSFGGTDFVADPLTCLGRLEAPYRRLLATSDVGMSRSDLRLSTALAHLRPFQLLGLTAAANSTTIYRQDSIDDATRHTELTCQSVYRGAGVIEAKQVVRVTRKRWTGHVYNLETKSGLYLASGIGNHNCRCSIGFRFIPHRLGAGAPALIAEAV